MGGLFGGGQTISTSESKIGALRVQTSSYGYPISIVYGKTRVSVNMIWYGDFKAIPHTSSQSSGGKGGGGVTQENTTYTYQTAVAMGVCEGPIQDIGVVWASKEQTTLAKLGMTLFKGNYPQSPWGYLSTNYPDQAIAYQRLAYVATGAYNLGSSAELPNHNFEVLGKYSYSSTILDANPKDVVTDFLTNISYGAGFKASKIADLTNWSNYCVANGIFISPAITEQKAAHEYLSTFAQIGNAGLVYSEGKLKIIPYADSAATGNGVTFTPNITPVYDLTDDDFIGDSGSDPIQVTRKTNADAYNQVQVEFVNRANQYNVEIAEARDQANIEQYGLRPMDVVKMHEICDASIAKAVAQLLLQRSLYIRNTYEFKLDWRYCLLEPMDLVTITDPGLGLNKYPIRITEIEDDEDFGLSVKAEEFPYGVSSHSLYPSQTAEGYVANYNVDPGNVVSPAFFEPPLSQTQSDLEVWAAVSGNNPNWGGCDVFISLDGSTYKRMTTIYGGSRYGVIASEMASGDSSVSVRLAGLGGQLLSASAVEQMNQATLCVIGREFVTYLSSVLTGVNQYTLSGLNRGELSTGISAHSAGEQFIRVDDAIVKSGALSWDMIGQTIYFKFVSFNIYGAGKQDLSTVDAYPYSVRGDALSEALGNVQNLVSFYRNGQTWLAWDAVTDPVRAVDYEIRKGASWGKAQVLGRVSATEFATDGDGTYWVSAHSDLAYSGLAASVTISGSVLVRNVVATYDEEATGWTGQTSGGLLVSGTDLVLGGAGLFSSIPLISSVNTVYYFGGVSPSGTYTVPAGHEVDIGSAQVCTCSVSYQLRGENPYALFSQIEDVGKMTSIEGNFADKVGCKIRIAVAQNDGVYAAWQDFVPGQYIGRKFKFQAVLTSADSNVTAILDKMTFTVDMPDRVDKGNSVAIPAAGQSVAFTTPFQILPNVQITILNAQPGDDVVLSSSSTSGFTVQVVNAGSGVSRSINWLAQGY